MDSSKISSGNGTRKRYPIIGIMIIIVAAIGMIPVAGLSTATPPSSPSSALGWPPASPSVSPPALLPLLTAPAYAQEEEPASPATITPVEQIPAAVEAELEDEANVIPGTAVLLVYSDTPWTGTIVDSSFALTSLSGTGDDRFEFACEGALANFAASLQKQTDEGHLAIAAIQDGELIGSMSTTEPVGTVIISDSCIVDAAEEEQVEEVPSACLIATAAYGSELAPQVQFLREFREDQILSTAAGQSFMTAFNAVYYSFSPQVADYEREQPWLQQVVRISIYPLLGILTVSEKAYSVSEGEHGAVAAGLVASSLIGAVYLTPLAYSIKPVRQGRRPGYKVLVFVAAGVSVALLLSLLAENTTAMMITTSAFVVSISAISAMLVARTIPMLFKTKK